MSWFREVKGRFDSLSYLDRLLLVWNIFEVSPFGLYFFLISLSFGDTAVLTLFAPSIDPSSESSLMEVTGFILMDLVGLMELTCSEGIVLIELSRKLW